MGSRLESTHHNPHWELLISAAQISHWSLNLKFDLQGYHKQTKGGKGGKSFGIIWDYLADSGIPLSSHTRVTSSKSCQPSWRWREIKEEGEGQGVDGTFLVLWGLINFHFFNLLSIMNTLTVEVISGNKRLTLSNEIVLKWFTAPASFFWRQNQLVRMRSARKNVLFSLRSPNLSPLGRIFTSLPDFARTGRTHLIFGILNVKTKMSAYANEVLKKEAQNMVTCRRLIMLQNRFQGVFFFVRKGRSAHSCLKSSPSPR